MKTPVKFEIAKLLKEKEYNEPCYDYYVTEFNGQFIKHNGELRKNVILDDLKEACGEKKRTNYKSQPHLIIAPTIAEVVMWLYEKHEIWVEASLNQFSKPRYLQWMYSIIFIKDCTYSHSPKSYKSPTEAYEAAIEYTLKNLI